MKKASTSPKSVEAPAVKFNRKQLITQRENIWYPEPAREKLLIRLHDIATDPARRRPKSLAIIAEPNGGKSSIISRYQQLHPQYDGPEGRVIPSILVNMTGMMQVSDLSTALLEALGAIKPGDGTHAFRMKRFVSLAQKAQLGPIFLDEFHDCVDTRGRGLAFLRLAKGLLNIGLMVVPVGVEEVEEVIRSDPQLLFRLNLSHGRLNRIKNRSEVRLLLKKMIEPHDLKLGDQAATFILKSTRGVFGVVLDLIEETLLDQGDITLAALIKQGPMVSGVEKVI